MNTFLDRLNQIQAIRKARTYAHLRNRFDRPTTGTVTNIRGNLITVQTGVGTSVTAKNLGGALKIGQSVTLQESGSSVFWVRGPVGLIP